MKTMKLIVGLMLIAGTVLAAPPGEWVLLINGPTSLTNGLPNDVVVLDLSVKDNVVDYSKSGHPMLTTFPTLVNTLSDTFAINPTTIAAGKQTCKKQWNDGKDDLEVWALAEYETQVTNLWTTAYPTNPVVKDGMKAMYKAADKLDTNAGWKLLNRITALRMIINQERLEEGRNKRGSNNDGKDDQ